MSPLLTLNKRILDGWDLSVSFQNLESQKNLEKSHAWPFKRLSPTRKFFKGDHWIVLDLKQFVTQANHNKNLIFLYFLWLILLFDTQLKQVLQIYTNKSFSSSSYSCLPMKVSESEVYSKHIAQPLDTHCSCLLSEKFESCCHQNLYKISESKNLTQLHSYIWKKDFIIYQLHNKSSYDHLK